MNAFETKRKKLHKILKLIGKLEPKPIKLARLEIDQSDFTDRLAYHQGEVEHYQRRLAEIENQIQELNRR